MGTTGRIARGVAAAGLAMALVMSVPPLAGAEPGGGGDGGGHQGPGFFGGDRRGGEGVSGRAVSRGETDTYALGLRAQGKGEEARGGLFFGHRGAEAEERFMGEVTCLAVGDDGVVQVSGSTRRGHDHQHGFGHRGGRGDQGGEEPKSMDFAFTILTKSDPQQFSLPRLGEAGTLTPCGGGDDTTVPVSRGGFRTGG